MQKIIYGATLIGALALIAVAFSFVQIEQKPALRATNSIARIGDTEITLELARTDAEKTLGLGGRPRLDANHGMLFLNAEDGYHAVWMKDMRFSIDILWLAEDGRVVDIKENAAPDSYPQIFTPKNPSRFILETNAGFASSRHVNIGARATLPPVLY